MTDVTEILCTEDVDRACKKLVFDLLWDDASDKMRRAFFEAVRATVMEVAEEEMQRRNEAAEERRLSDFHGASEPVTEREKHVANWKAGR